MYKIKQTNKYPAAIKYSYYTINEGFEDLIGMENNLDSAIYAVSTLWFDVPPEIHQDFVRYSELLSRTSFYYNNEFKPTDLHSPNPKQVYRQAVDLRQKLIEYCQGTAKFVPSQMKDLNMFLDNIQELSLNLKSK